MNKTACSLLTLLSITLLMVGCVADKQVTNNTRSYCLPNGTLSTSITIQSHRSYCIELANVEYQVGDNSIHFKIVDDQGDVLKSFVETHTKFMHVIVVSKDLEEFQHVHPTFNSETGEFSLEHITFNFDGEYRLFADFTPDPGSYMNLGVTTHVDLNVGKESNNTTNSLAVSETSATIGDYTITLENAEELTASEERVLGFSIRNTSGLVTTLQPYLGALGHSVVLKETSLDYIHAHPVEESTVTQSGTIHFMVTFPDAGLYKLFTQFQINEEVITVPFVIQVEAGDDVSMTNESMPGMEHSMMGHANLTYENTEYGFMAELPSSWEGYVVTELFGNEPGMVPDSTLVFNTPNFEELFSIYVWVKDDGTNVPQGVLESQHKVLAETAEYYFEYEGIDRGVLEDSGASLNEITVIENEIEMVVNSFQVD